MRANLIKTIALLLVAACVSGCAYIDRKQGEWIFSPTDAVWRGYDARSAGFAELFIPVGPGLATGRLHAWWSPAAQKDAPVLLYLHGARWNLTGSVTRIPRWNRMGFSVLAIDYRGFGKSTSAPLGAPTEASAAEDVKAAWEYLASNNPNVPRFIFGHSLGASLATQLAVSVKDDKHAKGLILEAPFTNIPELIKTYPLGFLPVGPLVTQRFDNLERIDDVTLPLLIAHGTNDNIVPFGMGEKLFAAAKAPKKFFRAEGGSHHNLTSSFYAAYSEAVWSHFGLKPNTPRAGS